MNKQEEQQLKTRLERSLYRGGREITDNEWEYLKAEGVIWEEYENRRAGTEKQKFEDLRYIAKKKLERVHLFFSSSSQTHPEEARKSQPADGAGEETRRETRYGGFFVPAPEKEEDRDNRKEAVDSRGLAIHTYERLYANKNADEIGPTYGAATFVSEGGSGGIPEWTVLIQAQAWTPAEQIRDLYQRIQDDLSYERGWKVRARTFHVVRFVWEIELDRGTRPTFLELKNLWNERSSKNEAFKCSRAFRKCFLEGELAVLPRYRHNPEHLKEMIDNGSQVAAFDRWAERFRRKL